MTRATRFNGALLRAYPLSYRRVFGEEMLETFQDWDEDMNSARGLADALA